MMRDKKTPKEIMREELLTAARTVSKKLGHRIINVEFTMRTGRLKTRCKRCDWRMQLRKSDEVGESYFCVAVNDNKTQAIILDNKQNIIGFDRFLSNLCPKVSCML